MTLINLLYLVVSLTVLDKGSGVLFVYGERRQKVVKARLCVMKVTVSVLNGKTTIHSRDDSA
jgi:hypothetical protein